MDGRSRDSRPHPSAPAGVSQPSDVSQVHTTLLRPSAGPIPATPTAQWYMDRHAAEARLWRDQAEQLVDALKQEMNRFARAVDRWQRLTRLATRTVVEEAELAAIERDLPPQAQRMARSRERWMACLVAAREHDDAIERLRATPSR